MTQKFFPCPPPGITWGYRKKTECNEQNCLRNKNGKDISSYQLLIRPRKQLAQIRTREIEIVTGEH